ncbi:MAG: outer membrane beta-barrel protein [Cytophagales bacterium]|nr:outer membrane beta-barrel protein [Cytophagales bacterium]
MKAFLLLLFLWLPLAAAAQNEAASTPKKEPYAPGKWYVGIKREMLPFEVAYAHSRTRWGLMGGFNLLPRLAVQTGVAFTNLRGHSSDLPPTLAPPMDTYTGNFGASSYGAGVYVPVMLRYSLLKPFRRVQPYVLGGVHLYYARRQNVLGTYENGRLTGTQTFPRKSFSGIGAGAGLGLRVRIVNRFSLFGDFTLGRVMQKNVLRDIDPATSTEVLADNRVYASTVALGWVYDFE